MTPTVSRRMFMLAVLLLVIMSAPQAANVQQPSTVPTAGHAGPPASLLGLWESTEKSTGGIGAAMELRADWTVTLGVVVLVEAFYRISGSQVILSETAGGPAMPGPSLAAPTEAGEWKLTGPDNQTMVKSRVGSAQPGKPPVVGVWKYPHPSGAPAWEQYTDDGRLLLRVVLRADPSQYRVDGDSVTITSSNTRSVWSIDGNDLLMKATSGRVVRYRRASPLNWYELKR